MKRKISIICMMFIVLVISIISNIVKATENTAQVYIDYPTQNQNCNDKLYIHGWLMSAVADKSLKLYIDNENTDVTSSIQRYNRPDVTGSIKGYGSAEQNPLAGYKGTVDISQIKDGTHNLIAKVIDNQTGNVIGQTSKTFIVKKYKTQVYIDYPKTNTVYKSSISVHGWVMSELKDKDIKVYIDNNETNTNLKRYNRPDVTGSVKGYGTAEQNPLAGYDGTIYLPNTLIDGAHTVTIRAINPKTNEIMAEDSRKINLKKYNTSLYIDYPVANSTAQTSVNVHGWVMSEQENKEVKVYLDNENTDVTANIQRYNRPDVTGSIKGYGTAAQNQLAGYTGTVDTSKLKEGKHEIIVKVIDSNTKEVLRTRKKNILCRKI